MGNSMSIKIFGGFDFCSIIFISLSVCMSIYDEKNYLQITLKCLKGFV